MQDLPYILKGDNLKSLDKALDLFIALKFCLSDFFLFSEHVQKMLGGHL